MRCRICRNKRPPGNKHPSKTVIFQRDGSWNIWVHKTDGSCWVIFQRGEYMKPMGLDGWFLKGGITWNRWLLLGFGMFFYGFQKSSVRGVYFGKYGIPVGLWSDCFADGTWWSSLLRPELPSGSRGTTGDAESLRGRRFSRSLGRLLSSLRWWEWW